MQFSSIYSSYERLCLKVLDKDDKLINSAKKVIGKALVLENEKKEFFQLLSLLNKKISEDNFVSCYYKAFKDVLTGPKWKSSFTPKDFKVLDVFSKYNKKDVFVTILKFILVLEQDQDLEYNFIQAMFYLVYSISIMDNYCYSFFYLYLDIKELRAITIKFIKSLNNKFHDSILSKIK